MAVRDVPLLPFLVLLLLDFSDVQPADTHISTNYYDTLGVEPSATDSQIKKAFRKLAVKNHPDKSKSADAEKTFREVVEAYTILSNKEKRRLYDSVGHEAFLNDEVFDEAQDESNEHFSFSDILHDFNDSPFGEEPHVHWTFLHDWEDEDGRYERNTFEPGLHFYFEDENEDEYLY